MKKICTDYIIIMQDGCPCVVLDLDSYENNLYEYGWPGMILVTSTKVHEISAIYVPWNALW